MNMAPSEDWVHKCGVVFASWLIHVLVMGFFFGGCGPLYAAIHDHLPSDSGLLAVAFTCSSAMYFIVGPVASLLTNKYGERAVTCIGGVVGSCGLIFSSFSTSVYHLYPTLGVLTGLGFGIAYIPAISSVGKTFQRHRTIALSIAVSGNGIGAFIFPPMLQFFLHHYDWRGTMLLTGAVCLNICVSGGLMGGRWKEGGGVSPKSARIQDGDDDEKKTQIIGDAENKNAPWKELDNTENQNASWKELDNTENQNAPWKELENTENQEVSWKPKIDDAENQNVSWKPKINNAENHKTSWKILNKTKNQKSQWKEMTNMHVFRNKTYLILCLNNTFFLFGLSIISVHLSAYTTTIGFSKDQGAMLFSAMGISNFIGCFVLGVIANAPCIKAIGLYTVSFFIMGVLTIVVPVMTSYIGLVIYAILFGFFRASFATVFPEVLVDILGVELLTSGYGYVMLFDAIGILLGAPIAGWLYDGTGMYSSSLFLGGSSLLFSALIMLVPWCFSHRKKRHTLVNAEAIVHAQ